MNKKEYLKEVMDFLPEVEWNAYNRGRVEALTNELIATISADRPIKHVYIKHERVVNGGYAATQENMQELAMAICAKYNITFNQLMVNSAYNYYTLNGILKGKRNRYFVEARAEFIKSIVENYPRTTYQTMADFIGYKDHTSIMHLLFYRKIN